MWSLGAILYQLYVRPLAGWAGLAGVAYGPQESRDPPVACSTLWHSICGRPPFMPTDTSLQVKFDAPVWQSLRDPTGACSVDQTRPLGCCHCHCHSDYGHVREVRGRLCIRLCDSMLQ
jgi:hypothetical protein